jgi:hypothetical protein
LNAQQKRRDTDGDGVRKENQKLKSKNQKCNKDEDISN